MGVTVTTTRDRRANRVAVLVGAASATAAAAVWALAWAMPTRPAGADGSLPGKGGAPLPAGKIEYNRDIRPILSENCFHCHGPDSASRQAGLRLDLRDAAVKAKAIVPGDVAKSTAIERILTSDPDEVMPPPKSHKKLTDAQRDLLKRWVAEGAEYQPHWSFIPPKRPAPPAVKDEKWVRNPIDRFILAELERRGLSPAPEADRRTLARRAALDITGLPPSPEEVEAFVNDRSPDAYERYVDSMMASLHWGEHRGRYWLDAARYADTHGIHFDNFREMWSYREWVISAFNRNLPFDRFTVEQLAGDLLPDRTLETQVASGFNRCNITTNEGGVIAEEYLVLYARDRTETTAQVWMGLTAGCAVCHDHKFDPVSMKDFYSLAAFFNNTTQGAMDGNIRDTPPIVVVPRLEDRPRWEAVSKELAEAKAKADARRKAARGEFDKWLAQVKPAELSARLPTEGLALHAPLSEGDGKSLTVTVAGKLVTMTPVDGFAWEDGILSPKAYSVKPGAAVEVADAGDFERDKPFTAAAWVKFPSRAQKGAIVARMEGGPGHRGWDLWYEDGRVGTHIIHKWPESGLKVLTKNPLNPPNDWHHVAVTYDGSGKAAGVKVYVDGAPQPVDAQADKLKDKDTVRSAAPLTIAQRGKGDRLTKALVQDVRLYSRALTGPEAETLAKVGRAATVVAKPADKRSNKEKDEVFAWWLVANDPQYRGLAEAAAMIEQEEVALRSRGTVAHVMAEKNAEAMAYILFRGEYDKRRDPVKAETPSALPPFPKDLPRNRLGLAQWLLRPEHPLTARVTVNRFWQEVFGTGLVRTSGDFGATGEPPSHPDLLDWLAVEFREGGWDVKRFFRLMLTSAAYRQSAQVTKEKLEKDPANRLLSRGPRFRMDAEMIRDNALAASGLLSRKLGGPSVKPYQPEGVWEAVAMIGSNTRDYKRDAGDALYRRSLYTFWKRAAPPASMEIFNAPNRETCCVRRERTNTPLQALVTLNDVQFVEAARFLAQRVLREGGPTPEARLDFLARRVLCRPLSAKETAVVRSTVEDLLAHYRAKPDEAKKLIAYGESKSDAALDPAELAAWTMTANELLNLDEVVCK